LSDLPDLHEVNTGETQDLKWQAYVIDSRISLNLLTTEHSAGKEPRNRKTREVNELGHFTSEKRKNITQSLT